MKLSVDMADSGAPASERKTRVCGLCWADVDLDLSTCPACGASLPSAQLAGVREVEPMSTAFDAELARANLFRMRADYKQAEDLCLSVLKRFPNSIAAHMLLGDIYSDQGQLEQSAQWYELALDLDPSSTACKQKLDDVREQIKERDHISSIEHLGLPERERSGLTRWVMVGGALVVVLLGFVYAARHGRLGGGPKSVITTPIRATQDMIAGQAASNVIASTSPSVATTSSPPNSTESPSPPGAASEDRSLFQSVSQKSPMGSHLISVLVDPRTKNATLTYSCAADEDERKVGAILAKTALEQSPDATTVTIRSTKNDRVTFMADVPRARLAETLSAEWQSRAGSTDEWIDYVLTNEWPAKAGQDSAPVSSGRDTSTAPVTSSGSQEAGTGNQAADSFPDVPDDHWATERTSQKGKG